MTYISANGTIQQGSQPWGLSRIFELFWGFLNLIVMFFRTLINPDLSKYGSQYTRDYRPPGQGPPRPPKRKLGGFGSGGVGRLDCSAAGGG